MMAGDCLGSDRRTPPFRERAAKGWGTHEQEGRERSAFGAVGDVYEGPLDLLLDLIRKQDIDIYDIPIGAITEQYLTTWRRFASWM